MSILRSLLSFDLIDFSCVGVGASSTATPLASATSASNTSLVAASPFLNTLPILFCNWELIQPDKLLFCSGLKFLIWGISSAIVPLTKSSWENPGGFSLGILLLINPCKRSYEFTIAWSAFPPSHSAFVKVYLPSPYFTQDYFETKRF